nr:hypothetical protein [Candidatus Dormibacteraeota bacterium]
MTALVLSAADELAGLHDEPAWLRAKRRQAFAVYERLALPQRTEEEWRRTSLKGLDLDAFQAFEPAGASAPATPIADTAGVLRQSGSEPGKV